MVDVVPVAAEGEVDGAGGGGPKGIRVNFVVIGVVGDAEAAVVGPGAWVPVRERGE